MAQSFIPYSRQKITEDDIQAIVEVLKSDFLTTGPKISEFETKISHYVQSQYACAVSNATAALHLGCMALDVKSTDYVWTSPNSFVASSNCALYCEAKVDFVDINSETLNICEVKLEQKLKSTPKNKLPKLVIPVHFAGRPCNMKKIYELSQEFGFKIMEDASHALGSDYFQKKIGNCSYSDLCVFSFHPVKPITTGEGGAITTNNELLYSKLCELRSHGITRSKSHFSNPSHGPWYYEMSNLGYNYRLTDLQAALGMSQLSKLDSFISTRMEIAKRYSSELKKLPLKLPLPSNENFFSWHIYVIQLDPSKTKLSRLEVFEQLSKKNLGVNVHYIPIHIQPYYQKLGFKKGAYPVCEYYYDHCLSIPISQSMNDEQVKYVINCLENVFS